MVAAIGVAVAAEDVGHLQRGRIAPGQLGRRHLQGQAVERALSSPRIVLVATCV